jgi:hypothetical protein
MLTHFVSTPVSDSVVLHACEVLFVILVFLVLSAVTWLWLGSKESS